MSTLLDSVTGGILPYVYIKKITLNRAEDDPSKTDVTVLLELYQDKNRLSQSTWLNSLSAPGTGAGNLLDSIYIQPLVFYKHSNVMRLFPSYAGPSASDTLATIAKSWDFTGTFPGSAHYGAYLAGKDYLPRRLIAASITGVDETQYGDKTLKNKIFEDDPSPFPWPMKVKGSSLLGDISDASKVINSYGKSQVREEIINGKPYYVVPFEYKQKNFDQEMHQNLGFAFYTFLHLPEWLNTLSLPGTDPNGDLYKDFYEKFIVEGPLNTEVVMLNGQVQQTREGFFLPNGVAWNGSVHLHAEGLNPSPVDNYAGDGGLSDLSPAAPYRGWMVGESHAKTKDYTKLRLSTVPNNKISDFRSGLFPVPLDTALGLGEKTEVLNLSEGVSKIEEFLVPFQKEKRREMLRDNDSEYSKLYICRDKKNNARGLFFINFHQLLQNNSSLYPIVFDKFDVGIVPENLSEAYSAIQDILINNSKILELKVYRDRVKKHVLNTRYEKHDNDEVREEPSKLIGTISDGAGYQTPNQGFTLEEVTGVGSTSGANQFNRYFVFSDFEVGKLSTGLYSYRVELSFKDGTYDYVYKLLKELSTVKVHLSTYYDIATSHFTSNETAGFTYNASLIPNTYEKKFFKKYYSNGSFTPEFLYNVMNNTLFAPYGPWLSAPAMLTRIQTTFGLFPAFDGVKINFKDPSITNLLDPVQGSPEGIEFFMRLIDTCIKKLSSLLGGTKVNKSKNNITPSDVPNGYSFQNIFDVVVSPSDSTIMEEHSFDHPQELFEATSNENIYVDYLSVGLPLLSGFNGMRSLTPEYFLNRCRLDSAKFSPHARDESGFDGIRQGTDIGTLGVVSSAGGAQDVIGTLEEDSLSHTGCSYLTPSIVELSDPLKNTGVYNYYYTCFKPGAAATYLDVEDASTDQLYSSYFTNWQNYDSLYASLFNYSINKKNNASADLTDSFIGADENKSVSLDSLTATEFLYSTVRDREPWKRIMEELSITIHDASLHDSFFRKETGPAAIDLNDEKEFPLKIEDFSDGMTNSKQFVKDFLADPDQKLIRYKPFSPSPKPLDKDLPNSWKIKQIHDNHLGNGRPDGALQPKIQAAFQNPGTPKYNTFFYFNIYLTAKIEYFQGIYSDNSKNDTNSWALLKKSTLTSLQEGEKLFCRMSLYEERRAMQIKLPMLDKYFLIYGNATNQTAPVPPPAPPDPPIEDFDDGGIQFWMAQNLATVNAFLNMTEKGIMDTPLIANMPPYTAIFGPDFGEQGPGETGGTDPSVLPPAPGLPGTSPPSGLPGAPGPGAPGIGGNNPNPYAADAGQNFGGENATSQEVDLALGSLQSSGQDGNQY